MLTFQKKVIKRGDFTFKDLRRLTDRAFDLQVGIDERRGSLRKVDYYGKRGSESVSEVAKKHEYGDGHIQERSFLRSTFSDNSKEYKNIIVRDVQRAALLPRAKITAVRVALNLLGKKIVKDVHRTIMKGIPPSLSVSTLKNRRKAGLGFIPLLATRQLMQSIGHKVKVTK